ncbi:MAG TPA: hypothetical protein VGS11_05380 [Candidatus Bathyarchaeia archaeon]|nr:hypothetical protein [Candidatus Bathyarchaeia archaeon]
MAPRKPRKVATKTRARSNSLSQGNQENFPTKDSIKAAEDLALTAFASGLKLAAAFGTVAAKTTSLALASIATGADKFSELVKQEALRSQKLNAKRTSPRQRRMNDNKRTSRRERKLEVLAS